MNKPAAQPIFDRIAHHWWDETGPMALLHAMTPLRLAFIQDHSPNTRPIRILDVGCGAGILSEALAKSGYQVTGIDPSDRLIKTAKIHAKQANLTIQYECICAKEYLKKTDPFDAVVCSEVLEHAEHPEALLADCHRLCKPEGPLIFSTINQTPKAFFGAIFAAEYLFGWIPKGTHQYDQFIKPSQMIRWARAHQRSLTTLQGIEINPWQKSARLTSDTSMQYIACF
jgi:2-polyprenyl-6-hydroxyphenyl methylase / 3-demethylubiquinone-9 3-methyltransferase